MNDMKKADELWEEVTMDKLVPISKSELIKRGIGLYIGGKKPEDLGIFGLSKTVGTVLQDTDGQFIGLTVAEDIAFVGWRKGALVLYDIALYGAKLPYSGRTDQPSGYGIEGNRHFFLTRVSRRYFGRFSRSGAPKFCV